MDQLKLATPPPPKRGGETPHWSNPGYTIQQTQGHKLSGLDMRNVLCQVAQCPIGPRAQSGKRRNTNSTLPVDYVEEINS